MKKPAKTPLAVISIALLSGACTSSSAVDVSHVLPERLALSLLPPAAQQRLRVEVVVPGVLDTAELAVDVNAGTATGVFAISDTDVTDAAFTFSYFAALNRETREVLIARAEGTVSIVSGIENEAKAGELIVDGERVFDQNRNGRSNLDDLILGLEPALVPPPIDVSPLTVGFESGVEVGGFTRDFVVMENTTLGSVEVAVDVRLAPGVTVSPLEDLFESGGAVASRHLVLTLAPEQEQVLAVTFAPVNPLFVVGRLAVQTRIDETGVVHGQAVRVVGNPEGPIPRPPPDYVIPMPPASVGGYTGTIDVYPAAALFSRAPRPLAVDEVDAGAVDLTLITRDAEGSETNAAVSVDVDRAFLLVVPARHRFSASVEGLAVDVDMYAIPLDQAFAPTTAALDCVPTRIGASFCSTGAGVSSESVAFEGQDLDTDTLLLLAFDRIDPAGDTGVAVGTVQTGLFSVPEFLNPCDPMVDPMCVFPIESNEACPAAYLGSVCGAEGGGTQLTLRGHNFVTGAQVTIGNQVAACAAVVHEPTYDRVDCSTPVALAGVAGGPAVRVSLTNPDGETATLAEGFSYVPPPPTIFSVLPSSGPSSGGNTVQIIGLGLLRTGGTFPTAQFGTEPAGVLGLDAGVLRVIAPVCMGCAGTSVDVVVANPDGQTGTIAGGYTYNATTQPPPVITGVTPPSASAVGGDVISIDGTGFVMGTRVLIGGAFAQVTSSTPLQVITPAGTAGPAEIEVVNPDGQTDRAFDLFTYDTPVPNITQVLPDRGSQSGGTPVEIQGTGFATGARVIIGGALAPTVTVFSSTRLNAVTPPGQTGPVDVTVLNLDGGTDTLTGGFTYDPSAPPTITGLDPSTGPPSGSTAVIIDGTGFQAGVTARFGGSLSTTCGVVSSTRIVCLAPQGTAGAVDVTVINPDSRSVTSSGAFTYTDPVVPAPVVFGADPGTGSTAGGGIIDITGEGFEVGTTVMFGLVPGTVNMLDDTATLDTLTVTTPPGVEGIVTLRVQNPDGQYSAVAFEYVASGTPVLLISEPAANALDVPVGRSITLVFNEPMDPLTLDPSTIVVNDATGQINGTVAAFGQTAIFTPVVEMNGGELHTVVLTTGVQSAAGVPLAIPISFSFTTRPPQDVTPPSIIGRMPMDMAVDVALAGTVVVTFDEDIDPLSVRASTFVVEDDMGVAVPGSRATSGDQVLFAPLSVMADGVVHTVRVTPGVTDLAGNGLFAVDTWVFTTVVVPPDTTPPLLDTAALDPMMGATGVSPATNVAVVFDDPIDPMTFDATSFIVRDMSMSPVGGTIVNSARGGVFIPSPPFQENHTYTVELTTTIQNQAGLPLASMQSYTFATRAFTWQGPEQVCASMDVFAFGAGILDNGNAIAVWRERVGVDVFGWNRFYTPAGGWGTPFMVSPNPIGYHAWVLDRQGNGWIVWTEVGPPYEIKLQRYRALTGLDPMVQVINSNTTDPHNSVPRMAVAVGGHAIIQWEQASNPNAIIARRFNPSTNTWRPEEVIKNCSTSMVTCAAIGVSVNTAGRAVSSYRHGASGGEEHYARIWITPTFLTSELIIGDPGGYFGGGGGIIMPADGRPISTWTEPGSGNFYWSRWSASPANNGSWSAQAVIDNLNWPMQQNRMTSKPAGHLAAIWAQNVGGPPNIVAMSEYNPTTATWDTPFTVDSTANDAVDPHIGVANDVGNAVAVWMQQDGSAYNMYGRIKRLGVWGSETLLEAGSTDVIAPRVSVNGTGAAVALWRQFDGTFNNCWVNFLR